MRYVTSAALVAALLAGLSLTARAQNADTILVNGKIVTVDDRFTIAEALAVRGGRVVAVGTSADIDKLKGPQTHVMDLGGRTVIPGLIDNHAHWIRAAEHDELRFDGVTLRQQALKLLTERVSASKPGEWIAVLGGWSEEQFTDDPRGFPKDELDRIAPNNPVVLQAVYIHSYLNSAALVAAKIDGNTPDPRGGKIEKDASGKPTGRRRRRRRRRLRRRQDPARYAGNLARQHPQTCRLSQFAGRDRLARRRRPRHGRQAL